MKEIIFTLMLVLGGFLFHIFGYGDLGNYVVIIYFGFLIMGHIEDIEEKLKNK